MKIDRARGEPLDAATIDRLADAAIGIPVSTDPLVLSFIRCQACGHVFDDAEENLHLKADRCPSCSEVGVLLEERSDGAIVP